MSPDAFLAALQLSDSALPIGRFSHSYGLEEFLAREPELREGDLVELIASILIEVVAPLDGVAVAEAHRLAGLRDMNGLVLLDFTVSAHKFTPSSRQASTACGRRFAALTPSLTDEPIAVAFARRVVGRSTDGNLSVMEGVVTRAVEIGPREAVLLELRATTTGLLSAGVRLGRISATRAQALATALIPTLCDALEVVSGMTTFEMRAVGHEFDLAAMWHGGREGRLFAT